MSAPADRLREQVANLAFKAHTGHAAVAAARDIAHNLPRELAVLVQERIKTNDFREQWKAALEQVAKEMPDVPEADRGMYACAHILAWQTREVARLARIQADRVETERAIAEGRARGISEALTALSPPPPPAEEAAPAEAPAEGSAS